MIISIGHGFGHRKDFPTDGEYVQVVKYEVISQLFALLTYPPGKASIAVCLMKIFPGRRLHWILWTVIIINTLLFVAMTLLQLLLCHPVYKQWDLAASGTCLEPHIIAYFDTPCASIGALSDFILSIIPWIYILRLQLALREKIAIGMALSLGFGAGIFAIIKTYYATSLSARTDYAYDTVPLILWSFGETCAMNVAACIPTLRPLLQKISHYRTSTHSDHYHNNQLSSFRSYRQHLRRSSGDERTLVQLPNADDNAAHTDESLRGHRGNTVQVEPTFLDYESQEESQGIKVTRTFGVSPL